MINIFNKAVGWLRRDFYFTTQQVICIVIMILFIALLLRIACWWVEPVISRDGIRYIEWAEALKTANGDFDILTYGIKVVFDDNQSVQPVLRAGMTSFVDFGK